MISKLMYLLPLISLKKTKPKKPQNPKTALASLRGIEVTNVGARGELVWGPAEAPLMRTFRFTGVPLHIWMLLHSRGCSRTQEGGEGHMSYKHIKKKRQWFSAWEDEEREEN